MIILLTSCVSWESYLSCISSFLIREMDSLDQISVGSEPGVEQFTQLVVKSGKLCAELIGSAASSGSIRTMKVVTEWKGQFTKRCSVGKRGD